MSTRKNSKSSTRTYFQVGDLIEYSPYSEPNDGAWIMKGDLGVVLDVTPVGKEYYIVRVKWVSNGNESDMACDVINKIESK